MVVHPPPPLQALYDQTQTTFADASAKADLDADWNVLFVNPQAEALGLDSTGKIYDLLDGLLRHARTSGSVFETLTIKQLDYAKTKALLFFDKRDKLERFFVLGWVQIEYHASGHNRKDKTHYKTIVPIMHSLFSDTNEFKRFSPHAPAFELRFISIDYGATKPIPINLPASLENIHVPSYTGLASGTTEATVANSETQSTTASDADIARLTLQLKEAQAENAKLKAASYRYGQLLASATDTAKTIQLEQTLASEIEKRAAQFRFHKLIGVFPIAIRNELARLSGYSGPQISRILTDAGERITHYTITRDLLFPPSGIYEFLLYKEERRKIKAGRPVPYGLLSLQDEVALLSVWQQLAPRA